MVMASARSTILVTRPFIGGDTARCSAQVMVLGGLMALPGGIITGIGYAGGGADTEEFYVLGPILLSLGSLIVIMGVVFKVLILRGLIKPGPNTVHGNVVELPHDQPMYPWTMSQPVSVPNFPPPYSVEIQRADISQEEVPPMYTPSVEVQSTNISQESPPMYTPPVEIQSTNSQESPPMYTPSVEIQSTNISQESPPMYMPTPEMDAMMESSAHVNEAFSDIPAEPPPPYEEAETPN